MRSLTRNLAVLAAFLTLSGCHIAIGDGAFSASEDFEETLPFGSGSSLELTNVNGHGHGFDLGPRGDPYRSGEICLE